jgi:PHD/YefM family antitoxin component YafN of YafNO toxin-antitoxin module
VKTATASVARRNLNKLLNECAASGEPLHIVGGGADAVLVSFDVWRGVEETLHLALRGMRRSIRRGIATRVEDCTTSVDW